MRSRIEMIPATCPSSTTGRWRKPPWIMSDAAWSVVSVAGHPLGDARPLRVTAGDGAHEVALREDAFEVLPLEHEHCSDPSRDHALRGLAEPVARSDGQQVP
jgi:hypothetical protein